MRFQRLKIYNISRSLPWTCSWCPFYGVIPNSSHLSGEVKGPKTVDAIYIIGIMDRLKRLKNKQTKIHKTNKSQQTELAKQSNFGLLKRRRKQ